MSAFTELQESIDHWERQAAELERRISEGYSVSPVVDQRKADTYRQTAQSLRLEQSTGIPHCVCHLQPRKNQP